MVATEGKRERKKDAHAVFQNWFALTFLGAALAVALWIFFGPDPEDPVVDLSMMFFVELPVFIVLALVGLNALVRRGMGATQVRRRR